MTGKIFKKSIVKFFSQYVKQQTNTSTGVIKFGYNDNIPYDCIRYINDSGIAKKCVNKLATYIASYGFTNPEIGKLKSNNVTFDKILQETANYIALHEGAVWRIARNSDGTAYINDVIPFNYVRKNNEGEYIYNHTRGDNKFDKSQDVLMCGYRGPNLSILEVAQMVNQYPAGELLYIYNSKPDAVHYPVPSYYAGIEDIRTSAEIQKYDLESVLNGFVPSGILTIVGGLDDSTKDATGRTERDYFVDSLNQFTGEAKDQNGLSGRSRLLILEASTKDEIPTLQTYDAKAILDSSNAKKELIDRAVCRHVGVHPVLVGFSDASVLGNQQAIANASNELAISVIPMQKLIEEAFSSVYPGIDFKIAKYTPINYIPSEVLAKLSTDELRALGGYAPVQVNTDDTNLRTLEALNSLSPLVANKVLESLTEDEIRALIGKIPKSLA